MRRTSLLEGNPIFNGIENFWDCAKTCLAKFGGFRRESFYFHLRNANLDSMTGLIICAILYGESFEKPTVLAMTHPFSLALI